MFSNYIQKIFNPNSTTTKESETKLQVYSSNTLLSKRVSTNQQKQKPQIILETYIPEKTNNQISNTPQTYEPIYSTKRKNFTNDNINGDEFITATYSTNTFTASKLSNRNGLGNILKQNETLNNNRNINDENEKKEFDLTTFNYTKSKNFKDNNTTNSFYSNTPNGNFRISEQIKMLNGIRSNSSTGLRKSKY